MEENASIAEEILNIANEQRQRSTGVAMVSSLGAWLAAAAAIAAGLLCVDWPVLSGAGLAAVVGGALVVHVVYGRLFGANAASSQRIERPANSSHEHDGPAFSDEQRRRRDGFNALRRASFPGPYPNGWYVLGAADAYVAGQPPKALSVLGREIVVFRGAVGKQLAALDAHCPHLGAHLGVGSRVVGDCVECPFHQWRLDKDGRCVDIPYVDGPPPSQAHTFAYPVRELIGLVWLWFDAERGAPLWEPLVPASLRDGSMYYGGVTPLKFDMHISEMFENSADERHFNTLHAPFPLWPLGGVLNLRHAIKLDWPNNGRPDGSHLCLFRERARVYLLDAVPVAPEQHTNIVFDGPSIMHFMMSTPVGRIHFLKSMVPVAPFKLLTEDRWWCDHHLPRWFGWLLARIGANALEQDRLVWENKIYRQPPTLVKGERPFSQHRQWYRQFYSQNSVRFPAAPEQNHLDW